MYLINDDFTFSPLFDYCEYYLTVVCNAYKCVDGWWCLSFEWIRLYVQGTHSRQWYDRSFFVASPIEL